MQCPQCRAEIPAGSYHCKQCGTILAGPEPPIPDAVDNLVKVIPFKNPYGLISYYLGIFGLIPILGIPLGITAIILGILGLNAFKNDPRVRGAYHAYAGIALGTLVLLGHAAIVVLFFLARYNR